MQLPDREFYSLQSLAKRWHCDVEDILEWCRMQYLVPAVAHGDLEVEVYSGPTPRPDLGGGLPLDDHELVNKYVEPPGVHHLPLFPFHLKGQVDQMAMLDIDQCFLAHDPRGGSEWLVPAGHVEPQPLSSLLVHTSEVARFEKQFGGTAEKPPTSKAINNALRTIAILARILAAVAPQNIQQVVKLQTPKDMGKPGPLGTTQDPSANAIAELVLDHLGRLGIEPTGQSNSAVRDRISKGMELLKADL